MKDSIVKKDKLLFTPGPLTTSPTVKQAMLHDAGSWHYEFNALVRQAREEILSLAGVTREKGYEAILMQGSGTYGVESVLSSAIPQNGKILVLANGAYGERMLQIAKTLKLDNAVLRSSEDARPNLDELRRILDEDSNITHVGMIHCETTTGILNSVDEVAQIVKGAGRRIILDAMSSFGAIPIDIAGNDLDFVITSPNKCLESVPGFSIVIARRQALLDAEGAARSVSLDLLAQLRSFEANGQFRFTPPTHAILAFMQALKELREEGGPEARLKRYQQNHAVLLKGMRQIGFKSCLAPEVQSCVITAFYYPKDRHFSFTDFYHRLSDKGFIIYPGKVSRIDSFRIGNIGHLTTGDIEALLKAVELTIHEMGIEMKKSPECVCP